MSCLPKVLQKLIAAPRGEGFDEVLTEEEKQQAVEGLLEEDESGHVPKGAVLALLAREGETPGLLCRLAETVGRKGLKCVVDDACDIVGTGGDGKNTLNISTPASLVAAAMGLTVTKHGSRSASANSGSADVAEQLGGCLHLSPPQAQQVAEGCGYCFLFAPAFHPELRHVAGVRKALGVKTVFNLLGPLLNPACPAYMVVGVGLRSKVDVVVGALRQRQGLRRALVVHSDDGMDKVSPAVPTHSWLVEPRKDPVYRLLDPLEDFGIEGGDKGYYEGGGGAQDNAAFILDALEGKADTSKQDFVLVQAAALAHVAGLGTLRQCMDKARAAVASGKARKQLDDYVRASTRAGAGAGDILLRILRRTAVEVGRAPQARSLHPFPGDVVPLHDALSRVPLAVCAELKRASPSEGDIAPHTDLCSLAATYASAGVQVISVLTEPVWFKGSLDVMREVRNAVAHISPRPALLRKDFVFTRRQVVEARAYGADTVLLIVAAEEMMKQHGETLTSLVQCCREHGMEPLVEVVTEAEVDTAVAAGARVIGINNRDLKTFKVDLSRTGMLIRYAASAHPDTHPMWVALSGISTAEHVHRMKHDGAAAVLVGTSLMRADDPGSMIKEWLAC